MFSDRKITASMLQNRYEMVKFLLRFCYENVKQSYIVLIHCTMHLSGILLAVRRFRLVFLLFEGGGDFAVRP